MKFVKKYDGAGYRYGKKFAWLPVTIREINKKETTIWLGYFNTTWHCDEWGQWRELYERRKVIE